MKTQKKIWEDEEERKGIRNEKKDNDDFQKKMMRAINQNLWFGQEVENQQQRMCFSLILLQKHSEKPNSRNYCYYTLCPIKMYFVLDLFHHWNGTKNQKDWIKRRLPYWIFENQIRMNFSMEHPVLYKHYSIKNLRIWLIILLRSIKK